ncbi:hypothetical protein GCM10010277_10180 [Streptomyces longisporoflavus]|uniref:hypothetical protein n=1 Tax=Streptomyces longisporoflavus TaxID=28044 RepID=UPI00167D0109|nr:hypothetical protein [Streptomyces longisporoflavus]GGV28190.1 hypothetical protein GCM10010277_10180 [Streptomyces longisporoflavus]
MRIRQALAVAVTGAALSLGASMPAQAAPSAPQSAAGIPSWCVGGAQWSDRSTYGASCDVAFAYYAKVKCSNGSTTKTARGVVTNDGRTSYAYCTAFGTSYRVVPGSGGPVKA